jgi:REP element-mobilizing transposase RayT
VISRAVDRHFLFDGDAERARYLQLLGGALRHTDAKVLAWCVMSNHVHLVVEAGQAPLWRLMKSVHVGYANWKNRREGRIGPLFADRYKAVLVDREEYLLELVRYVHLNPVRARVAERPEDSRWSSHRAYLGLDPAPSWLDQREVLDRFGSDPSAARRAFAGFVLEGVENERSPLLSGDERADLVRIATPMFGSGHRPSDGIVGSDAFVAETLGRLSRPAPTLRVRGKVARARVRPPAERLVELICEVLGVDRAAFDERPKARGPRTARYLLARVWVGVYHARRIDLARSLRVRSEQVTRWHHGALERADELHDALETVTERLDGLEAQVAREQSLVEEAIPGATDAKERRRLRVNLEVADE